MRRSILMAAVGLAGLCVLAAPLLAQEKVDPAELQRITAQHPDWARWLTDPELAKLTLAGPKMPNSQWRADDIRRPQPVHVETGNGLLRTTTGRRRGAVRRQESGQMDRRSFQRMDRERRRR